MKKITGIILLMCLPTGTFAQINELKQAQDKRKERMDPSKKGSSVADPLLYVNPFIGTGGHGHTFPGPVMPFGMVQLGPDTRAEGWDGCSGYHYSDSVIYGFSHTHLSGTGIPDYADLLIVPQVGTAALEPRYKTAGGYGASFSHSGERAIPGLYEVELNNPNVGVRLTTTKRCGIHEYTFHSEKGKKYLVLDLGYRDKLLEGKAISKGKTRVIGFRRSAAWATNQHFYFDLETSIPFSKAKWISNKKTNTYVMVLEFPEATKQVMVRVGVSGTDFQGATANLTAEATTWDMSDYIAKATQVWRKELTAVNVSSSDKDILVNFYTALYHTYIHPSLWTDVDGRYRGFNNSVQQSDAGDLYSVFSLWDTYRGANPLYTILQPQLVTQFIESFYRQYKETGLLPVWTLSNNETNCMIGYHAASVIADATAKGIIVNNATELLQAMIETSNFNHFGKSQYIKDGFISAGDEAESVSKTLEYAYDDWCIAEFAQYLKKDSIVRIYRERTTNWMNLYNPESGFFQPRNGGMWLPNFVPNEVNHHFTEANAWQYSLAVPQHFNTLIHLKGGNKAMENFLDSLFLSSSKMSGREQADITGLIGQYAHGNEPSHHMAYLYNYCGAPQKTQALIDRILREEYRNAPDGLAGNEDCGQMSAWYVMSALGFYPVTPGDPTYAIGKPIIDHAILNVGSKPFEIIVNNNSIENKYIQSMTWNGEPYENLYLKQEMFQIGGTLVFEMGPNPGKLSGMTVNNAGRHAGAPVTMPYFVAPGTIFSESIRVSADKLPFGKADIIFTTDGSDPTETSGIWEQDLTLYNTTVLKARLIRELYGKPQMGKVVTTTFTKYQRDKTIKLETAYANQYAGGGAQGLVDGQFGKEDYRGTEWQGFQGEDVVALLTLDEQKDIDLVSVSYLQDTKSWIFYPKALTVEISVDGTNFTKIGTVQNTSGTARLEGPHQGRLSIDFPPVPAKYVRLKAENYGVCPDWHLGAGGKTWLFLDEIIIE